jgi:hypothetical protein
MLSEAQVVLTHAASQLVRRSKTDTNGAFEIPLLAPGAYDVRIDAAGFQTAEVAVSLDVGERRIIRLTMSSARCNRPWPWRRSVHSVHRLEHQWWSGVETSLAFH